LSARQKFLGKQTKSLLRRERRMCANYGLVRRSPHSMTVSARVRSHITSWPTDGATDSIGANWPIPHAGAGSRRTPLALRRERSVEQLQPFPLKLYSNIIEPVALPQRRRSPWTWFCAACPRVLVNLRHETRGGFRLAT